MNTSLYDIDIDKNNEENIKETQNKEEISLNELSKKVDKLQEDVAKILILLESSVKENCDRMGEHINFIEDVYSKVKYPMEYVADKITSTRNMLPSI